MKPDFSAFERFKEASDRMSDAAKAYAPHLANLNREIAERFALAAFDKSAAKRRG